MESLVQLCLITGHHPSKLQACAEHMTGLHEQALKAVELYNPLTAIKEKYRDRVWHCASQEPPLDRAALVFAVVAASKNAALTSMQT